ncbi:DNA-3-methyladenine glycosylase 2 family protein [Mycetocola tolaasinivorans]|uniref:DNA-3-methyladenine glycosylase II n=1 Tax=Mycetocola tolaasinivorans TaxID=76635 RepID=A0A3L7A849_9MICO|nr:AlkA N-terminal domain-containing protein [Mycetocola tolaasinivorans]RLP75761.1 DNA-3-methyladenine glycosylase 2 family protein [Mycetocola tolaasinivorans]
MRAVCRPGDPGFAEQYRAIDARDTRFDGQFYTAVSSTGIYCRPSCPARTPAERYVSFYRSSAAAQVAGYRACKRCLPEAVPGTPEWNLRGDVAGRAMRLIGDGQVDRAGVEGLSERLGYTPRHLRRILTEQLGAGPLALARARRAHTARALLVDTDLDAAQVAFAAGFGSIRQFNDTILEVFAMTPLDIRARAKPAARVPRSGARPLIDLQLPVRQPYDAPGVFAFLASRAIEGVESVGSAEGEPLRYARTLRLPGGPAAIEVHAENGIRDWTLRARIELSALADVGTAVSRVRRLLDLDADPLAVDHALRLDQALAPRVSATPGIRVPGAVDSHEIVIRALIGQQISVAAARTHLGRLAAGLGTPYASAFEGLTRLFPEPGTLAEGIPNPDADAPRDPERILRLPDRQVRTVRDTAAALASGELTVHLGQDTHELRAALEARPGIGPWTASYIAMRVLGDPDAWLPGDVALLAGARALGILADLAGSEPAVKPATRAMQHRTLESRAADWAPWRSYAAMHLWRAAS